MSGGCFNYSQDRIADIVEEIQEIIDMNGEPVGHKYKPATIAHFADAVTTLKRAYAMAQRIDWLLSGDDGEETFMRRWDEDLRKLNL